VHQDAVSGKRRPFLRRVPGERRFYCKKLLELSRLLAFLGSKGSIIPRTDISAASKLPPESRLRTTARKLLLIKN